MSYVPSPTNILFGYPEDYQLTIELNYVLLIGKYIYKQKQNNAQPFLPLMLIELKKPTDTR
jgi:hypothetical protein